MSVHTPNRQRSKLNVSPRQKALAHIEFRHASSREAAAGDTFVDLEFDTGATGGALLGDIVSLVSLDVTRIRSLAAYPSSVSFGTLDRRDEMRSP
jgi:hypothetical protein